MTLEIRCGLCGQPSAQPAPSQPPKTPGRIQAPDLDTRPGEPLRSTVRHWMQLCPECGYAAADISAIHETAVSLIETEHYQRVLFDSTLPEPARPFLCHAMILDHVGQFADAGWTALHGAWTCDDALDTLAAASARNLAIDYWKKGKRNGQSFGEEFEEFALAADVLRRAGRFEEALIACNEALDTEDLPELLDHILRFEKTLIQKRDAAAYNLAQVPGLQ